MKLLIAILSAALLSLGVSGAEIEPLPIAGVTAIAFSPEAGGQALVSDLANLGQVSAAAVEDGTIIIYSANSRKMQNGQPQVVSIVNLILSDQGQTLMARTRNFPLAADEVVALRAKLGLPK